ncbi:Translocation protein SEC63 -like protein [Halotydeus destructor]|nr:Translocation protein SEC63 -like protein [Halotydeus destructor]
MAGSKFQYDESGGTFFYFILSFLALVVIPCTYYFWPKEEKKDEVVRDRKTCHCEQCGVKSNLLRANEPWRKVKQRTIKFLLILGWVALAACAYKVANLQHDYINWDPFEILEIDPASTPVEIKKAYRRLSLIFHPDKETGDEKKFMRISKAYAALTDEEARKNWEQYGNPDGPGAMSFGIALPSWIVEKENSIIVLGIYALVFMIALPTVVGIWWYRSVKYGGDQVLLDTTQLYYCFIHKTPHMMLKRVIMIVAASLEFEKTHNGEVVERPTDNFEVPQLIKELPTLGEKNKERPLCFGYSIKARALLHAHLSRLPLPQNSLEIDKNYVVKKCPALVQEFVQCVAQLTMLALAGRIQRIPNLETLESAMKLSPQVVQALWDSKSPLLQMPHMTEDLLRHCTSKRRYIRNIEHLAQMKDDDRRTMLRNLSDDQYEDIVNVLGSMPLIVLDVRSEVLDDEESGTITAGAIVTVTVALTRKTMSSLFGTPPGESKEVEDADAKENEIAAEEVETKPKPKVWEKKTKKAKGKGGKKKKPTTVAIKKPLQETQEKEEPQKDLSEGEESDLSDNDEDVSVSGDQSDSDGKPENTKLDDHDDEEEWDSFQSRVNKKEKALDGKSKQSHSVHCPYFADDKQEYWWIYLADKKRHALTTVPVLMTNLVDSEEIELKFTAPPKPGVYNYSVVVRSDSYIDCVIEKNIKLDVKEAKQIVDHPQWDISEEEEDVEKEEDSAVEDSDLLDESDEEDDVSESD